LTRKYRHDVVVSIAERSPVWKVLKLTKPEIHHSSVHKNSSEKQLQQLITYGGPRS